MSYCDVQDVLYALEITGTDARKNAFITTLINTAEKIVEEICGTEFDEDTRVEEIQGECSRYLFIKGRNITKFYFVGKDEYQVIKVFGAGLDYLSIEFTKDGTLRTTINTTSYSTSFDKTKTITDVVTYLDGLAGITATLEDSNYGNQNALSLWSCIQNTESEGGDIYIYLDCATAFNLAKISENQYLSPYNIGYSDKVKVVYLSGYATALIPDNVKTATILAASMMFRSLMMDVSKKSESIGDYSYSNGDLSNITQSIRSATKPILAEYRIKTL